METLLLLIDAIAMVIVAYMGLMDDRRPPGQAHTSLFRAVDGAAPRDPSGPAHGRRGQELRR